MIGKVWLYQFLEVKLKCPTRRGFIVIFSEFLKLLFQRKN